MPQRSIAMAADSTQHRKRKSKGTYESKSGRDKNDAAKVKRHSPTSARSSYDDNDFSEQDSDLDIEKELKPIGGYIDNKHEMVEQMFRSISKKKVRAMLPDILRSCSHDDLKKLCERQLLVMSHKRIIRILEGVDLDAISSSDESEVAAEVDHKPVECGRENVDVRSDDDREEVMDMHGDEEEGYSCSSRSSSASRDSKHSDEEHLGQRAPSSRSASLGEGSDEGEVNDSEDGRRKIVTLLAANGVPPTTYGDASITQATSTRTDTQRHQPTDTAPSNTVQPVAAASENQGQGQEGGKSQFEILELEMRARAIKAMLHKMEKVTPPMETPVTGNTTGEVAAVAGKSEVTAVAGKTSQHRLRRHPLTTAQPASTGTRAWSGVRGEGSATRGGQGSSARGGQGPSARSLSLDMIIEQQAVLQAKIEDARRLAKARVAVKVKAGAHHLRHDDVTSSAPPAASEHKVKARRASHVAFVEGTAEEELADNERDLKAGSEDLTLTSDSDTDNLREATNQPTRASVIRLSPNSVRARRLQRAQSQRGATAASYHPLPTRGRGFASRRPRARGRGAVTYYMPSSRSYQRVLLQAAVAWRGGYRVARGQGQWRDYRRRY